jgi:uncharacterized membrane protein YdbT with pleckstrin-like domain
MMEPSRRLLDMNPDGSFRDPPQAPLATRLALGAIVVAVLAGGLALAALAFWLAIILIPLAIGAALVAYLGFRFQLWRAGIRRP